MSGVGLFGFGYGLFGLIAAAGGGGGSPSITSLNYAQGDRLGGGQSIVITGTNLGSASSVVIDPLGTPLSWTITGNTSTTITCTLGAHATAGVYTLRVTTPGGHVDTTFEYWDPPVLASCTLLVDKGYTGAPWVPRIGSNLTTAGADPAASGGGAVLAGAQLLHYPATNGLMSTNGGFGASQGTMAWVQNATAAATHTASSDANPCLASTPGSPSIAFQYDSNGLTARMFDASFGASREASQAMGTGLHFALVRFADNAIVTPNGDLSVAVDGTFGTPTVMTNFNQPVTAQMSFGVDSSTSHFLNNDTVFAIVAYNVRLSDADATKNHLWAQQRFGTP